MSLRREASSSGLWVNDAWTPRTAGTFAVVVGVSDYEHLDAAAQRDYDLAPLYTSALTALRFVTWLEKKHRNRGHPLAMCWTLMAPTRRESAYESSIDAYADPPPTFGALNDAIFAWHRAMADLPRTAARESCSIFFFSGHGVEVTPEKQILLPSDWQPPPRGNANRAVSTANLTAGLADLDVNEQFFFIDACRNDHRRLRPYVVEGTRILNERGTADANKNRNYPVFYASASGGQGFQPKDPRDGISLYGQALLDGLQGEPDIRLACDRQRCTVSVYPLIEYLGPRIATLLDERRARVTQEARLGGNSKAAAITEFPVRARRSGHHALDARGKGPADERFRVRHDDLHWSPGGTDVAEAHEALGSDRMSDLWRAARIYGLGSRAWRPARALKIHRIEVDDDSLPGRWRIELSIPHDEAGFWLEIPDRDTHYACLLLTDQGPYAPRVRYTAEIDLTAPASPPGVQSVARIEVNLSDRNQGALWQAAVLWARYRWASPAAAAEGQDVVYLRNLVADKRDSPLAATIAALVLLRVQRLDVIEDWLGNLARWFPALPDAVVLRAEQLLRENQEDAAMLSLARLSERGLPFTAEGFGYAVQQVEALQRSTDVATANGATLEAMRGWLGNALRSFRPGGLMSVLAMPSDQGPAIGLPLEDGRP